MQKNAKIGLILGIGAAVAALSYYFLIYKPSKGGSTITAGNSGAGTQTAPTTNTGGNTQPQSIIGKNVYAKYANVPVVKINGTPVKTAALNEWIGIVSAQVTLAGRTFYKVSGDNYVTTSHVYAK